MTTFSVREFNQSQDIFTEGSIGDVAYILKTGSLEISVKVLDRKIVLSELNPPAVFGEMALLLKGHKRTATATALELSEVVEIHRQAFDDYMDKSPPVIANILKALANRLKKTTMKAAKAPDTFIGMCEILNLLAIHANSEFLYEQIVNSLSNAFFMDIKQTKELLVMMEEFRLIEIKEIKKGRKIVYLPEKDSFLKRAQKIYTALKTFGADGKNKASPSPTDLL